MSPESYNLVVQSIKQPAPDESVSVLLHSENCEVNDDWFRKQPSSKVIKGRDLKNCDVRTLPLLSNDDVQFNRRILEA